MKSTHKENKNKGFSILSVLKVLSNKKEPNVHFKFYFIIMLGISHLN